MKKNLIYMISSVVLLLAACTEDKGNYDYVEAKDIINITISGIPDVNEVVLGEHLHISPEVTGMIPGREYAYEWYVISKQVLADGYLKKTIATTLDLDQEITALPTAEYYLYLKITDVETGVYVDNEKPEKKDRTSLIVSSSLITAGWYVLKEVDGMTDVDFCKYVAGSTPPNDVYTDILHRLAEDDYRIEGSPVSIAYQNSGYKYNKVNENGTLALTTINKTLHIATTEDLVTFNAEDLTRYATLEDQFYYVPETWNPQFMRYALGVYLINDGELYTRSYNVMGLSKFGSPKLRGTLFPSMILFGTMDMAIGFNTETRSFGYTSAEVTTFEYYNDRTVNGEFRSTQKMDYDMVAIPMNYMNAGAARIALMKSRSDGKYYTIQFTAASSFPSSTATRGCQLLSMKEVYADSKLPKATAFTSVQTVLAAFGVGNELWYYDHDAVDGSASREFLLNTYPEDEEIITLDYCTVGVQFLAVLTWNSSNDTWKLYLHTWSGITNFNNYNTTPTYEYSGEGKPKMVVFRAS